MSTRLVRIGVVAVIMIVALCVGACGDEETATTAAPTETTAAPTETTAAPSTDTTAPTGPATGEPIKIGINACQTGHAAIVTPSQLNGAQLEVKAINAAGGVDGRPLELVIIDNKTDPPTAVSVFTKLMDEGVVAMCGAMDVATSLAIVPMAEKYEIPLIRYDGGELNPTVADAKWSFMVNSGPRVGADNLLVQIQAEGWKNILALADALPANQDMLVALKEAAASSGVEITVMSDTWALDATDVTPIVNKIVAQTTSVNPDAIIIISVPPQAPMFMKGLRSMGVTVPIQGGPAAAHPAILAMGPEAVEGFLVPSSGLLNPSQLPEGFPGKDITVDFAARYQAEYGQAADTYTAAGYNSVHILYEALKSAGTDKAKIRDAVESVTGWVGLGGNVYDYSNDHADVHGGGVEWVVKGGQFEFVRTLAE